jgi:hypothetical protein
MNSDAVAGAGILMLLLVLAGLVFLIVLFVAPFKLYGIHREIQNTNNLLRRQVELLTQIEDRNRAQVGILATVANTSIEARARATS